MNDLLICQQYRTCDHGGDAPHRRRQFGADGAFGATVEVDDDTGGLQCLRAVEIVRVWMEENDQPHVVATGTTPAGFLADDQTR